MMKIQKQISLLRYNTFGINAKARYFTTISSVKELRELCKIAQYAQLSKLILGGGSNILLTKDFDGIVIKNDIKGISVVKEDAENYFIRAGAGENWHRFVMHSIDKGYAGIENLSLIPGNVGAAPMQNIGAYGVELENVFEELEAVNIKNGNVEKFSKSDCQFGYRNSIFKNALKNKYAICSVTLKLNKKAVFNTSYGTLQQELDKTGIQELSVKAVSEAVCNIRRSKLPDPSKIANAGSFFKNPVVSGAFFENLKSAYPDAIGYQSSETETKLAAGWLIEQCGWKGKRINDAGVHDKQALVLVNHGKATGKEIYELSEKVVQSVKEKFGVDLEKEVNIF